MAAGIRPEVRDYAKAVFAELLATRSQRTLARELDLHQSRISTALNEGRVSPESLRRAAGMAGRASEEVEAVLKESVGPLFDSGSLDRPHRRAPRERLPDPVVAAIEQIQRLDPGTDLHDAQAAAHALFHLGHLVTPPPTRTLLEALQTVTRLRAWLDQAAELDRLRWMVDKLRSEARADDSEVDPRRSSVAITKDG
ncbi:MAG TPA: hypothetical protein PLR99_05280 [Polyangiaceae bacterium]|nr:hypothetical protein [Polyangiaceae bacterium]